MRHDGGFQFFVNLFFNKNLFFFGQTKRQRLGSEIFDKGYNAFNFLMSGQNGLQNSFLRNFRSAGFYHHDSVFGAGHGNMHNAVGLLLNGWVDNKFTVHHAHNYAGNWSVEWCMRDMQRC